MSSAFLPSNANSAPAPTTPRDYEYRFAGLRAHNRWMADFCADAPGRRAGFAQLFVNDVDAAVREVRARDRLAARRFGLDRMQELGPRRGQTPKVGHVQDEQGRLAGEQVVGPFDLVLYGQVPDRRIAEAGADRDQDIG